MLYDIYDSCSLGYYKLLRITSGTYQVLDDPDSDYEFSWRGGHPISFQDRSIQYSGYGSNVTYAAYQQESFTSKGFTNETMRYPSCRQVRKPERYKNSGSGYQIQRQMAGKSRRDKSTVAMAMVKSESANSTSLILGKRTCTGYSRPVYAYRMFEVYIVRSMPA